MLHQDRRDPDAVVVERIDLDRVHVGGCCGGRGATGLHRQIDVGAVVVVSNTDLVHEHVGSQIGAPFVSDSNVDVVGERLEQLLVQPPNARGRRIREQYGHDTVRRVGRDGETRFTRAEHVDTVGRPEAQHEIDVVDDVVAVQVGEEDRPDGAATLRPTLGMHRDARVPSLAMHPFAAVDEVGHVADDDCVGIARTRGLGVRCAGSTQQDQPLGRIGTEGQTRRTRRRRGRGDRRSAAKNI